MTRVIITNPMDGAGRATEDPIEALRDACAHTAKDMTEDRTDAWIYGIVLGWDDDPDQPSSGINVLDEVADQHGWTPEQRDRLRRLHHAFNQLDRLRQRAEKAEAALAAVVLPPAFPPAP